MNARLWAAKEDPGLQSELGGEYTRPTGGCHEHVARFDPVYRIGEGPLKYGFKCLNERGAWWSHDTRGLTFVTSQTQGTRSH